MYIDMRCTYSRCNLWIEVEQTARSHRNWFFLLLRSKLHRSFDGISNVKLLRIWKLHISIHINTWQKLFDASYHYAKSVKCKCNCIRRIIFRLCWTFGCLCVCVHNLYNCNHFRTLNSFNHIFCSSFNVHTQSHSFRREIYNFFKKKGSLLWNFFSLFQYNFFVPGHILIAKSCVCIWMCLCLNKMQKYTEKV